jgi:hypothetical protein
VINERGPYLFVVDTATTNTVLTPALRDRLRVPTLPGPPVDVVSAAGSVRSHYYAIRELAVASVIVEDGRAVVMPLHTPLEAPGLHQIRGQLTEHGIILVPARVENTTVAAAFDSGGRYTIANSWLAAATGNYDIGKARNQESWVRDAGRQRYVGVTEDFARITLGPAVWYNRTVMIADIRVFDRIGHGTKPVMFVGMDLMQGRRVVVDYANASLWISR